ncbi:MAG: hypothetical protein K8R02_09335 [Anaerohalosphaeraceae bacterium]|nr:hypothetical protein [Anaerohalosphaeraceae bacterium]
MNFSQRQKPIFTTDNPPVRSSLHGHIAAVGLETNTEKFETIYKRITELFEMKNSICSEEISAIAEEVNQQPRQTWKLLNVKTSFGTNTLPSATVLLESESEGKKVSQACGYSSTDAICSAIQQATEIRVFLKNFSFKTIGNGTNAMGQAEVTAEYHNQQVRTKACSVDILEAVGQAYLTAINTVLDRIIQQLD